MPFLLVEYSGVILVRQPIQIAKAAGTFFEHFQREKSKKKKVKKTEVVKKEQDWAIKMKRKNKLK